MLLVSRRVATISKWFGVLIIVSRKSHKFASANLLTNRVGQTEMTPKNASKHCESLI